MRVKSSTSNRKIKRKVGYGLDDEELEMQEVKRMRKLSLTDKSQEPMEE